MNSEEMPLTPFERYMYVDDRKGYPMVIHSEWTLIGQVDKEALEVAWEEVRNWYPLLNCLVKNHRWRSDPRSLGSIQYQANGVDLSAESIRLSLIQGPVARLLVSANSDRTVITLLVHHAIMDGVGVVELAGDILGVYANQIDESCLKPVPPPEGLLPHRGSLDREVPEIVPFSKAAVFIASETMKFFFRRVIPISTKKQPASHRLWHMVTRKIDSAVYEAIQHYTRAMNVSVNDVVISAIIRSIDRVNEVFSKQNKDSKNRFVLERLLGNSSYVVNMPVLMRPRMLRKIAGCNMIGYAFLARRKADIVSVDRLTCGLADEVKIIQKWKLAGMFNDAVSLIDRIPGLLWLITRSGVCPATCVVSNLGNITRRFRTSFPWDSECQGTRFGNLVLVQFAAAAPPRPGTEVTGLVHQLGCHLYLTIRVSAGRLSLTDAQEILDRWICDLEESTNRLPENHSPVSS